jgi:hypothetical protein
VAFHRVGPAILTVVAAGALAGVTTGHALGAPAERPAAVSHRLIPQPPLGALSALTRRRLAPDSRRVDLVMPSFSHPLRITNPLFPVSRLHSAIQVGEVDGEPLKIEVSLLPETKTVVWSGRRIRCRQSQFLAYLKGRITEAAVDLYAQADDGSVWYFGEDVVDYARGIAATTQGTWLVGRDGPAAMIMPARPKVGDVYRTENIPGVAFEQVTVKRIGLTVRGPSGPVRGAMVGLELHQDESRLEPKVFAPGRAELFSGGRHDFEANALAVPADARQRRAPPRLRDLSRGAGLVFEAARSRDWAAASGGVDRIDADWRDLRADRTPPRLAGRTRAAIAALARAVEARNPRTAAQAALDVADAALDLQLRDLPPARINLARLELWTRRLLVDAAARNAGAVHGDVTTLAWIRDRIPLRRADGNLIDDQLRYLRSVADARELRVAMDQATWLLWTLAGLGART